RAEWAKVMQDDLIDLMHAYDVAGDVLQPRVALEDLPAFLRSLLDASAGAQEVHITHKVESTGKNLSLPRFLARHLLEPLLHNAVRALAGAGELRLTVAAPPDAGAVEITLEDSGPGWEGRLEQVQAALAGGRLRLSGRDGSGGPRGYGLKIVRQTLQI